MNGPQQPEEVTPVQLDRLIEATNQLAKVAAGGNVNTNTTSFNLGGAGLLAGFVLGTLGLAAAYGMEQRADAMQVRAESRELVMAAERRADMAQIQALQSQVRDHTDDLKGIRAWLKINGENLAKLEARNAH